MKLAVIIRNIFGEINYSILMSKIKVQRFLKKYYSESSPRAENSGQLYIYMADGRINHGGLVDRLRGIVALYDYCKQFNKEFKVNFISPFLLENILSPNQYNWRLDKSLISYNERDVIPVYVNNSPNCSQEIARRLLFVKQKQVHVYTNMTYDEGRFSSLFFELFKPEKRLQKLIDENKERIAGDYVSITFRFQQLLGDFQEGNFPVLSPEKQKELIDKCLNIIPQVYNDFKGVYKILVTADSKRFLKEVTRFDYVYIIPGEMSHMDFTNENDDSVYLKSFIDLFMISGAKIVYFASGGEMYSGSRFAKTAALLNNVPYKTIMIQ